MTTHEIPRRLATEAGLPRPGVAGADVGRWLHTTWYGGNNAVGPDTPRSRVLAFNRATATFAHPVRVRRNEDGIVEAWWWDDYRPNGLLSQQDAPPADHGTWRRFVARIGLIQEALLEQAEQELATRGAPAAGATLAPAEGRRTTTHAGDCE